MVIHTSVLSGWEAETGESLFQANLSFVVQLSCCGKYLISAGSFYLPVITQSPDKRHNTFLFMIALGLGGYLSSKPLDLLPYQ